MERLQKKENQWYLKKWEQLLEKRWILRAMEMKLNDFAMCFWVGCYPGQLLREQERIERPVRAGRRICNRLPVHMGLRYQ